MLVKYCAPATDHSGYGEASRHHLAALDAVHVGVALELVSYSSQNADYGSLGRLVERLKANNGDYDIKLLHTTPDQFKRHIEPGKYHVGFCYWETNLIPPDFAEGLQLVDEVWTGSQSNKEAILSTGVDKPVHIFPQPLEVHRDWPAPYEIPDFEGYLFYSIFEWTDRKNPEALLNAYWQEFQRDEPVGLLIKTYFSNFTLGNKRLIRTQIERLKAKSGLQKFPPVFLFQELMDRSQVMRLHKTGDCFVSAHRGEGWGLPQVEAALAGRPFISTAYGGCHEYFENGKDALLLPYTMTKVRGMHHSDKWYRSDQQWAEVDFGALRGALRFAYSHPDIMERIGSLARATAAERFNLEHVGGLMAGRLNEIQEGL